MFALHQSVKVFSQVFFKKLAGLGRAHKKTAFSFCQAFSFAPLVPKDKAGLWIFYFLQENYLLLFCALEWCFAKNPKCHPERSRSLRSETKQTEEQRDEGISFGFFIYQEIPLRALLNVGFDYENLTP